jgi:hypothetical protein
VAGDEVQQFAVAGGCCCELLISYGFAVFGDDGDVVSVGVGINADDDLGSFLGQYGDGPALPGFVYCTLARPADSTVTGLNRFRLLLGHVRLAQRAWCWS